MNRRALRVVPAVTLVLAAALVTTSCAAQPAEGGGGTSGSATLVAGLRNEVTTLDPSQASYLQVDAAVAPLYDTLTTYSSDGELEASLATDFSYNDDATELTLSLRDDVQFHDGAALTAADVVYSLDRVETLGTGIAGQMAGYAGSTAVDDHTVEIDLDAPDALFAGKLSRIYIVNSALVAENAGSDEGQSWLLQNDAGSGPYSLTSNDSGTITYSRFDDYFDFADDRAETLVVRRIDELGAGRDELVSGSLDVVSVGSADVDAVQQAGMSTADAGGSVAMMWFNNSTGPTSDPAVRKALRLAYDYQGGLDGIRNGSAQLNSTVLPAGLACEADLPTVSEDLDAAKAVLEDAGIDDLTITMGYQTAFEEQVQEATLLQSNLKQIGVTLNLEPIAYADYLTSLTDWSTIPEMMLATEPMPIPEPGVALTQMYSSTAVGTNKAAYSDPDVDALLDEINATPDADARCSLVQDVETRIDEADAAMPLYTVPTLWAYDSKVALGSGPLPTTPSGQIDYADLRLAE